MKRAFIFTALVCSLATIHTVGQSTEQVIVAGYLRTQKWDYYDWRHIQYKSLTHIIHAFLEPTSATDVTLKYNGAANSYENVPLPPEKKTFEGFAAELVPKAHENGVKVILGIAGAASNLKAIFSNPSLRTAFINQITLKCRQLDYDGVDLDYEYPASTSDGDGIKYFVAELYTAVHNDDVLKLKNFTITLACPKYDNYGKWFDFDFLANYCNWFNIMTYSYEAGFTSLAGHCSPLYAEQAAIAAGRNVSIDLTIQDYYITQRKVPKNKIVLGISFFGWVHQGTTVLYSTKTSSLDKKYWNFEKDYLGTQGWSKYWSDIAKVPYMINISTNELMCYDDTESVKAKCDYALNKGIKGVMIWELSQGFLWFNTIPTQPLLSAIGEKMKPVNSVPTQLENKRVGFLYYPESKIVAVVLKESSMITVELIDNKGSTIKTLVGKSYLSPGSHRFNIDLPATKGLYFMKLKCGAYTESLKVIN